jgi:periplasmic protein TonB
VGVAGGVEGGIEGGEVGGVVGGVLASVIIPEVKQEIPNRVTIERDKPLPLYPLSQVYPAYPEDARVRAWEDRLVVRYLIGKDGRVKEVTVVSPPEREAFVKPTLKAIRSWRFKPLVRNGERQEVVHELTVFYRLQQAS